MIEMPNPSAPRGACPSLDAPMAVADGLLARFRPVNELTADQVAALADAAQTSGNGRVEVTARGNLQVRGLTPETRVPFRQALDAAAIAVRTGLAIDASPLAGRDPRETTDPRPLAEALRRVGDKALSYGPLSPKLSIVVGSGGQVPLDGLKADIRLLAAEDGWTLELGHTPLGLLAEKDVPGAVAVILKALQDFGPTARADDLHAPRIAARLGGLSISPRTHFSLSHQTLGPLGLKSNQPALRIGLPFGQVSVRQLHALARIMAEHGVDGALPAPDRSLILVGFEAAALSALSPALAAVGYRTRPQMGPSLAICSGAEAGAKGIVHAADLALGFQAMAPEVMDGSFHLHVSTCAKGCSHAGRPGIVLAGTDIVLYRAPSGKPIITLDPDAIETAIVHLAGRIREKRQRGETVLDVLGRLGEP